MFVNEELLSLYIKFLLISNCSEIFFFVSRLFQSLPHLWLVFPMIMDRFFHSFTPIHKVTVKHETTA